MDLKSLRIGYVPYTEQFDQPGDRRRFVHFAKRRGLRFEIAQVKENYDVVLVSERGDLSVWGNYPGSTTKIVFDLVNPSLDVPKWDLKGQLRGAAKYISGEFRHLRLDYWEAIRTMCRRADAVICTAEGQRRNLLPHCKNVHVILDFQDFLMRSIKVDYSSGEVFHLVWEGLPGNMETFSVIREVLKQVAARHKIAIHLVTQLEFRPYMGRYGHRRTADLARKFLDCFYLYEWNEHLFSRIVTACDLAVIPMPLDDPAFAGKSANKLILFWRMGVPALVSATPAYQEMMRLSGLSAACRTPEEWLDLLERYMSDERLRREAGQLGKAFTDQHYSDESILSAWDRVFSSLFEGNDACTS